MKVEGILAHNLDYVIGQGDLIPWHHSGDFKRFKKITNGHNLLMGAKTFLGIAKNYFQGDPSAPAEDWPVVLPGRTLFVVGSPRKEIETGDLYRSIHKKGYGSDWVQLVHELIAEMRTIGVSKTNVRIINNDDGAQAILDRIEMNHLNNGETLFVAGGASIYDRFLPYCTKLHRTIIHSRVGPASKNLVKLTPQTIELIEDFGVPKVDYGPGCRWMLDREEYETCNDLRATYRTQV